MSRPNFDPFFVAYHATRQTTPRSVIMLVLPPVHPLIVLPHFTFSAFRGSFSMTAPSQTFLFASCALPPPPPSPRNFGNRVSSLVTPQKHLVFTSRSSTSFELLEAFICQGCNAPQGLGYIRVCLWCLWKKEKMQPPFLTFISSPFDMFC